MASPPDRDPVGRRPPPPSSLARLRPVVLVFEDANDARALASGILLHLHQDRKTLRKGSPRLRLRFERQQLAIVAVDIAPDALVVLDFDLEHGFSSVVAKALS